ncbi:MAG: hypothetical protein RQ714_02750 [Nitrosomonas sp.]|nr:hypothetical protein [Nitrosomonas sp.]
MKVLVYYRSGVIQVFIVPRETVVIEFRRMAEELGGALRKIEFPSNRTMMRQTDLDPGLWGER